MYTVFRKCWGLDQDVCWDEEYDYFESEKEAQKFARELEYSYTDEAGCPPEHPWYGSKFYVQEISEEYIRSKRNTYANWMANMV